MGGRYTRGPRIASGAFGEVFIGTDVKTNSSVAIKVEFAGKPDKYLRREAEIYQQLSGTPRVPELHWYGTAGGSHALVTELLGPSLGDLFELCSQQFSLKTVLLLAEQMLQCVENLHAHGVVHRDIKPDNFLIGIGPSKGVVHVVDFGLASWFKDPKTKQHVAFKEGRGRRGTRRYMSIQAGLGNEQSRRDDLESIGYVLLFFLRGRLPWQRVKGKTKDELHHACTVMKQTTSVEELCQGLPSEFVTYLKYCRTLNFEDRPDYGYLRSLMRWVLLRQGHEDDGVFDWSGLVAGTAQNAARNSKRRKDGTVTKGAAVEREQVTSETHSPSKSPQTLRLPSLDS